ncbi:MAG TPA: DUF58 domain-containing protein [Rhodocyclaceae bacterium]|nr:DUF58 domain-containing protein [Rhodocyclaceae bacterium]
MNRKSKLFRGVFLASRWVRERLSVGGLLVVNLTAFAAVFGLDTRANLAHSLFSLGFGVLTVDLLACLWLRRHSRGWAAQLQAERMLPDFVTKGEAARYRIRLLNRGARVTPAVELSEQLRQPWPTAQALRFHRSPIGGNRFDQRVGYPAFLDMLRRLRAVDIDAIALPSLAPGQTIVLEVPIVAQARGLAGFEQMQAILTGPLGLIRQRVALPAPSQSLAVLPQRLPIAIPPASGHRLFQPGGISLAQRVGDTEEFRSLRDYRPGDPLRSVHWRSFARTGKPMVREYQEEFFSRHALLLDTAASHPFAPALETAVSLAAWLVTRPRDSDSLLDLMFVGERVHRLTMGRGLGETDTVLRVLAGVDATPPASIDALLKTTLHHAGQISSLIAILLCWDEARRNAMRQLRARRVPLTIVLIDAPPLSADDEAEFLGQVRRISSAS